MQSVLGTILDPAADKALMTTLTITLTMQGLLPRLFSSHCPVVLLFLWQSFSATGCDNTRARCLTEPFCFLHSLHVPAVSGPFFESYSSRSYIEPFPPLRKRFRDIGIFPYHLQKFDRQKLAKFVFSILWRGQN
jgi:hypothetical protein